MQLPVSYSVEDGRVVASTVLPDGKIARASVPIAPSVGAVGDRLGWDDDERLGCMEYLGAVDIVGAIDDEDDDHGAEDDEVGRRRRRKRRRAKRRARRRRIFKKVKKVGKKIGSGLKKIAKSKLAKGLYKLAKKIPVYGQVLEAGVKAGKVAVRAGKGIARKVKRGKRVVRKAKQARGRIRRARRSVRSAVKPSTKVVRKQLRLKRAAKPTPRRASRPKESGPVLKVKKTASNPRLRGSYTVRTPSGRTALVRLT